MTAFSFPSFSQVQFRVLPRGKHTLSYNMYPLVCGEVLLPQIHVNLPQHFQLEIDVIAQTMLPTHVFVKVWFELMENHKSPVSHFCIFIVFSLFTETLFLTRSIVHHKLIGFHRFSFLVSLILEFAYSDLELLCLPFSFSLTFKVQFLPKT